MILFWDRNLGKAIPRALQLVQPRGIEIFYYAEQYPGTDNLKEVGDDSWLAPIGDLEWVVITQDHEYHNKPAELAAIKQHNVGCFYLWGRHAPKWRTVQCFARAYDRIINAVESTLKPFIFSVDEPGRLHRIL